LVKKPIYITLDEELIRLLRARRVNISRLLNELAWGWVRGPPRAEEIEARMDLLRGEERRLLSRLEAVRAEISALESALEGMGRRERDLEWRLRVLRRFKAEKPEVYEESLELHAKELGMEVEELRGLVEFKTKMEEEGGA